MEIEQLAVERCYALRSLLTAMTILLTQRAELIDAIDDAADAALTDAPHHREDLESLLHVHDVAWRSKRLRCQHDDDDDDGADNEMSSSSEVGTARAAFAHATYENLANSLAVAATWETRLRALDAAPVKKCALMLNIMRSEHMGRTEFKVFEDQLQLDGSFTAGAEKPPKPGAVSLFEKLIGCFLTLGAFAGPVYYLIYVFSPSYADQGQGGRALIRSWYYATSNDRPRFAILVGV